MDKVTQSSSSQTWSGPRLDEMLYGLNEHSRRAQEGQSSPTLGTPACPRGSEDSHFGNGGAPPLPNVADPHPAKPNPLVTLESVTPVTEVLLERMTCL